MLKQNRLIFMDLSSIISSFAVVVLHTSGDIVNIFSNSYMNLTACIAILINIIFAYGVPMFFMQSGANLLNYRRKYSTATFFKKRINKVVLPFIIWSLLGFLVLFFQQNDNTNFVLLFIKGSIVGPYWFFYTIIAFYLCVPFLSIITERKDKNLLLYVLIIALTVNSIIPLILQTLKINNGFNQSTGFGQSFPAIGQYLQWFIAGYFILNYKFRHIKLVYISGILSMMIEIILTFFATFHLPHNPFYNYVFGSLVKNYYDIQYIFAFITFFALFSFLKNNERNLKNCKFSKIIGLLSSYSYGVYLIHPILLMIFMKYTMEILTPVPTIIQFIILPIFLYLISILLTSLIKKIPLLGSILIP